MKKSIFFTKLNTLLKNYFTHRPVLGLLCVLLFSPFNAAAVIMSTDDIGGFGIDAFTRDTDQGLDFLDVTFSTGRSYNDVSGQFGIGGDFEGLRYATLDEVIQLANNFGVNPPFVAGNAGFISTDIAGLVDLLGVTVPAGPFNRATVAMTSTFNPGFPGSRRMVEFLDEFDNTLFDDRISSEPVFSLAVTSTNSTRGSYLVRAQPVSEPATLLLMLAGAGSLFGLRQRRRRSS